MDDRREEAAPAALQPPPLRIGEWMRQEIEVRLPRAWLVAGGAVFLALLLVAID
jgi:hypothetical protein